MKLGTKSVNGLAQGRVVAHVRNNGGGNSEFIVIWV